MNYVKAVPPQTSLNNRAFLCISLDTFFAFWPKMRCIFAQNGFRFGPKRHVFWPKILNNTYSVPDRVKPSQKKKTV